ncbi:MAG: DNA repair protein RecO [Steroidobacteraceae bacterium]
MTDRRVQLVPGYLLHHTPYRDTSRILEVLTRDHGRLTLFARGARGPKSRLAAVLQPFQPLLLSWSGRGEAPQLTGAELEGAPRPLRADCLMAAFYLNELILKLTTRHDPHPALYHAYARTLEALTSEPQADRIALARPLRLFERRLLEEVGYGLDLQRSAADGGAIDPARFYQFRPERGLVAAAALAPGAISGSSLIALAREQLADPKELEDARRLLKAALDHCLEGRELATRAVARAIEGRRRAARRD